MFGLAVIGYLFLGGVGGALSFLGGLVGFRSLADGFRANTKQSLQRLLGVMFGAALLTLLTGALLLLADAGNYQALVALFFPPRLTMLSLGTWAITIDLGLIFALFVYWQGKMSVARRSIPGCIHLGAALVGAGVVVYTGLFLASMRAVPLWHTFLVPVLFVLSSLSCACVILVVFAKVTGADLGCGRLVSLATKWDIFLVVLELLCALAFMALAYLIPREGSFVIVEQSAYGLLNGQQAWLWWGGFIGMGILATLALDIVLLRNGGKKPVRVWNTLAPAFCVLCGAFAMRYCIVAAGMHPVLSF